MTYYLNILNTRIIQHNLRIVALYYKRITCQRLSQLLNLPIQELEEHLSELSQTADAYVKIDRPNMTVIYMRYIYYSDV